MNENICLFVPHHKDYHSIHTINFVLENNPEIYASLTSFSVYRVHYVYSGSGILYTLNKRQEVKKGDVFFTFPSMPFCIETTGEFSYMYVSFVGARANMIMEKLGISERNYLFENLTETEDMWKRGIRACPAVSDIMSESVLLHTFSCIGDRLNISSSEPKAQSLVSLNVKKYIDDNFTNPTLSLTIIGKSLNYNSKYISHIFKKQLGISISEYITTIRLQHACALMQQGFTSISDIAASCGYSDPQYFSKLFRKHRGQTPREYIKHSFQA